MDAEKLDKKLKQSEIYKFWEKNQQFIHAVLGIFIVLLLAGMWFMQVKTNKLNEEISLNCGWGEEDYYCYCEKSEAVAMKNAYENVLGFMEDFNVTLDE